MNESAGDKHFWQDHKKELVIGGVGILAVGLMFKGIAEGIERLSKEGTDPHPEEPNDNSRS